MTEFIDVFRELIKEYPRAVWGFLGYYQALIMTIFIIWFFYKVTGIKVKHFYERIFIAFVFIILFITRVFGIYVVLLSTLVAIVLFTLYYRKIDRIKIVTTIAMGDSLFLIAYFALAILVYFRVGKDGKINYDHLTFYESILLTIFYLVCVILVKKYVWFLRKQLESQTNKIFLFAVGYAYVSLYFLTLVFLPIKKGVPVMSLLLLVEVAQILLGFYIYYSFVHIQRDLMQKKEQETLKKYAASLEQNQLQLRKFKHDYQNMLTSLKLSAANGDNQELLDKLEHYSNTQINNQDLWRFNDVDNIHNDLIKSIIISKLNEIHQKKIPYHFECKQNIEKLPNVDPFDLVRIIGVTFDNAIEASKNLPNAQVNVMIYQDQPGEFEYEIDNRCRDSDLSVEKMSKAGFTTKKGHKGLGLANVDDIAKKYDQMYIDRSIKDGWFKFTIVVE